MLYGIAVTVAFPTAIAAGTLKVKVNAPESVIGAVLLMTLVPALSVTLTWIWAFEPYLGSQPAGGAETVTASPDLALVGLTE